MKCRLCQQDKNLRESHIIPAFVYRWIKETSATGFLRFVKNVNLRVQDGVKVKLLCDDCEGILNVFETKFSHEIFYPYVNKELNEEGVAKGNIKSIKYKTMPNIIGLRELRENVSQYAEQVAKGKSFVVVKQSKPLFKISPVDEEENWETVIDFTKIKKGGVAVEDIVAAIGHERNRKSRHRSQA